MKIHGWVIHENIEGEPHFWTAGYLLYLQPFKAFLGPCPPIIYETREHAREAISRHFSGSDKKAREQAKRQRKPKISKIVFEVEGM